MLDNLYLYLQESEATYDVNIHYHIYSKNDIGSSVEFFLSFLLYNGPQQIMLKR